MEPVVETPSGTIRGKLRDGVALFRGIPYAMPPLGELRFRPPILLEELPSKGGAPFDAASLAPAPPQNTFLGGIELPGLTVRETSEDCLYLNVWTPGPDRARRPVMVWIHGGGFTTGAGSLPVYKGQRLAAEHDVVVVTLNYRLGVLGFLHLGLYEAQAFPACTNLGLRDQLAALHWVKRNIESFGGDPKNVTVFGESAGGMSIGALLGAAEADGLFARGILQSGACHFVSSPETARRLCGEVLAALGLSSADPSRLRKLGVDEILKVQLGFESPSARDRLDVDTGGFDVEDDRRQFLSFLPTLDGDLLERRPLERLRAGEGPDRPVIVGSTLEEFRLFATRDPAMGTLDKARVTARLQFLAGVDADAAEEVYRAYEVAARARGESTDPNDLWVAIAGDAIFRIPAIRLAEACADRGVPAYVYLFAWKTPLLGAAHGMDVPFAFGNLGGKAAEPFIGPLEGAEALSLAMRNAWTSFAREGTPRAAGGLEWPAYDPEDRAVLVFDGELRVEQDPYGDERRAWEGLL